MFINYISYVKFLFSILVLFVSQTSFGSFPTLYIQSTGDTLVLVNTLFNPPTAFAYDDEDGNISDNIQVANHVNIWKLSSGYVSYTIEDSDGNIVSDTLWVSVVDTLAPKVDLKNENPIEVLVNSTFNYIDYFLFSDNYDSPGQLQDNHEVIYNDLYISEIGLYSVTIRTHDTSGNWSNNKTLIIKVVSTLGITRTTQINFNVYPNPAREIIYIQNPGLIKGSFQYMITDGHGHTVLPLKSNFELITQFDISVLSSGVYYLTIRSSSFLLTKRLVIY